jgi:hypothetical protein
MILLMFLILQMACIHFTLYTDGTVNEADLVLYSVNFTLFTTTFLIGNLPPSPKPSPPFEMNSDLFFGLVVLLAVAVSILFFRRHKKTANLKQ